MSIVSIGVSRLLNAHWQQRVFVTLRLWIILWSLGFNILQPRVVRNFFISFKICNSNSWVYKHCHLVFAENYRELFCTSSEITLKIFCHHLMNIWKDSVLSALYNAIKIHMDRVLIFVLHCTWIREKFKQVPDFIKKIIWCIVTIDLIARKSLKIVRFVCDLATTIEREITVAIVWRLSILRVNRISINSTREEPSERWSALELCDVQLVPLLYLYLRRWFTVRLLLFLGNYCP